MLVRGANRYFNLVLILDALFKALHVAGDAVEAGPGESLEPIILQHRAIIEAIQTRDHDKTEQAMTTHLAASAMEIV
ncbi:hypothetical protein BH24ACT5_BH24ACT5_01400 [soil metagenome]